MWKNRELSLKDIRQGLLRLREKLERVLPVYVASLERILEMPVEFGRRWRASWIEEHLEKVRRSYQQLVNQGMVAGLFSGVVSNLMSTITRQPALQNPAASWQFAVSVFPSGEVKMFLTGMSPQKAGAITVSFEEFEQAVLGLKNQILSGSLVLQVEEEIPSLIYKHLARDQAAG